MADTAHPDQVTLAGVKVDDMTAEALKALMYPASGQSAPPALTIQSLERDRLEGTVSLVLRPNNTLRGD